MNSAAFMMNIGVITPNGMKSSASKVIGTDDGEETQFLILNLLRHGAVADSALTNHGHRGKDPHGIFRINHCSRGQRPLVLAKIQIV